MRVVFLGNHTVGTTSLRQLMNLTDVVGVVAHPFDPEDGNIYESVFDFAEANQLPVIRGKATTSEVYHFIEQKKPDIIWVTDYRYLLPKPIIELATFGAVNLHPSLLPKYRGRAPLNWALINGEKEVGVTVHFIDEGVDTGDIILQIPIPVSMSEDIGDVLRKLLPVYEEITARTISYFQSGEIPRTCQPREQMPAYPRRRPDDGKILWEDDYINIYNLVRAVTSPYPGAFAETQHGRVYIWKATPIPEHDNKTKLPPGCVTQVHTESSFIVKCGIGSVQVDLWSTDRAFIFKPFIGLFIGE